MSIKINNGVQIQLPQKATRRDPTEQAQQAQQAQNTNMEDFDYEIPLNSSIDALFNTILQYQQEMMRMQMSTY